MAAMEGLLRPLQPMADKFDALEKKVADQANQQAALNLALVRVEQSLPGYLPEDERASNNDRAKGIAQESGKVVLQAAILTAAAVIGLTLFTFWAAKKGYDFTFWLPFLSTSLNVLLVYLIIQIFVPLGTVGMTIFGCIATLVFSGFVIYDTRLLLNRYTYDEYVVAAISLYLDIINLFMAQITLSGQ
ncbi:hypothetical protein EJB05_27515, partial [Eragrostis curvula]